MDRSAKESDAASTELPGRGSWPGRRVSRDPDPGEFLRRAWVAAMKSTIAIHSGNGRGSFGGYAVAGANESVSRSPFPSIQAGTVPSFRESQRRTASVGGVV